MINNWEENTLEELCIKISAGGDKPKSFSKIKTYKFNIPVYANGIELNGLQGYTDKATITENAITISARGTIGFICKRLEPYCPIVRLISVIPKNYIYLDFLYYALHLMIYNNSGSSIPQLTVPKLKSNKIKYPTNIQEQKRITEKLDNAFQKIEALENNTKENIKNIEDLYNSYLNKIFCLNKNYEELYLYDVIDNRRSNLQIGKLKNKTGNFNLYGASGIVAKIDFYEMDEEYLSIVKDGSVGKIFYCTSKSSVSSTMEYLIPKIDINLKFLYYYLLSIDFNKYSEGSTIYHIYYKRYSKEKIFLPPIEEQKKIVDKLDIFNNKIQIIKENYQNKLTLLEKLKKSILNKAFNGEL